MDEQSRRDDIIDRELNRAFQTSARTPAGAGPLDHLDAERAAAWMDRGLDATTLASIDAHVADCGECQALVATLARTIPAPPGREATGWWARLRTPWLVPLAAAATAVAVWVAVPSRAPAPSPRAEPAAAVAQAESGNQAVASPPVAARAPEAPAAGARPDPTPAPAERNATTATPELKGFADQAHARDERDQLEARSARPDADAAAPAAPPPAPLTPAPALGKLEASAPAETPQRERQEAAAGSTARAIEPSNESRLLALRASVAQAPGLLVVAADRAARWRAANGRLEYAAREGAPWAPTGFDARDVTAASAPGGRVSWFVGRAGLVAVTTDGTRVVRVPGPTNDDVTGVQATDGRSAVVTMPDGRRYRTSDQGTTWSPVPE